MGFFGGKNEEINVYGFKKGDAPSQAHTERVVGRIDEIVRNNSDMKLKAQPYKDRIIGNYFLNTKGYK